MKKKFLLLLSLMVVCMGIFAGCEKVEGNNAGEKSKGGNTADKLGIVCTIFPEYDWVREILGDEAKNADITLLVDNGMDLHSYQPSAADMMKVATSDIFIYVGGESDQWVDSALKSAENKDRKEINLLEVLGDSVKEEELVEGMEGEEEEEEGEEGEEEEEGPEYDEHVWLSLKNSETLVQAISDAIQEADQDKKDTYEKNTEAYLQKLEELDGKYREMIDSSAGKTIIVADRFPFRYLTDDYDLDYYAAFVGCSAETEAKFETVTFLAEKVDELGISQILVIENSDQKIAKTVIDNTKEKNQKIAVLDSLQSVNTKDIQGGITYLSAMENNLEVLREALQ